MAEQNLKNHSRYLPLWHFIIPTVLLSCVVISVINFLHSGHEGLHAAITLLALSSVLIFIWFYGRAFALRAQDRAIRAEENFRHYIITGKPLDSRLRMGQIVALRFAGDNEFAQLAKKAVDENLGSKAIKMAIVNWKEDNNRV